MVFETEYFYDNIDVKSVAHGMGFQIITVVSIHDPGRPYHPRVFFTVLWQDPDGKVFGKTRLRIATYQEFRRRCGPYRYDFELDS